MQIPAVPASPRAPRSRHARLLLAAAAATVFGALATVQAQETESAVGFWQAERARRAPQAEPPAPARLPAVLPAPMPVPAALQAPPPGLQGHVRSLDRSRQAAVPNRHLRSLSPDADVAVPPNAKLRYARLPRAVEREEQADPRQEPRKGARRAAKGPMADILNDPTLRPGDIVMFPEGPKVFNGASEAPHRVASFEDAGSSRILGKGDRKLLAAVGAVPGAPAKVARAKVKAGRNATAAAADEPRTQSVRVVYEGYGIR